MAAVNELLAEVTCCWCAGLIMMQDLKVWFKDRVCQTLQTIDESRQQMQHARSATDDFCTWIISVDNIHSGKVADCNLK